MHYALFYDYVPDILERRTPFRPDHLALANEFVSAGTLLMAGAFADPVDGALFIFRADGPETVEAFVARDPYIRAGLVTGYRVRPWTLAVGGTA